MPYSLLLVPFYKFPLNMFSADCYQLQQKMFTTNSQQTTILSLLYKLLYMYQ